MSKPDDIYLPQSAGGGSGARAILMLTTDKTEDLEFFYPFYRFVEAGYRVDVVTPKGGGFQGKQGLGLKSSRKIGDVKLSDYDLLYIPGGQAPAALKEDPKAIELVKNFAASGKPIAAICHGPQLLAAADLVRNRRIAAWPDCQAEVEKAGATYIDQETVRDGNFITARWPGDLPSHLKETLALLGTAETAGQSAPQAPKLRGVA